MVLLIDNFDSFTFNLVHYFEMAGADVVVRRNNEIGAEEALALRPSLICFSPGPGRPEAAGAMPAILAAALGQIPIFGVCLGHQALCQHLGAVISHAPELMHGKTSEITHNQKGVFAGLSTPLKVCRYHSLAAEAASIPSELEVTARTSDGVVMAVQHHALPAIGVQFHPEALLTEQGQMMVSNVMRWAKATKTK